MIALMGMSDEQWAEYKREFNEELLETTNRLIDKYGEEETLEYLRWLADEAKRFRSDPKNWGIYE